MITLTFDTAKTSGDSNDHQELRSAFERFNWRRMGGSVFTYEGVDWLNEVIPSLMFFRALIPKRGIELNRFTLHASSFSLFRSEIPTGDVAAPLSIGPRRGPELRLNMARHVSPQCNPRSLEQFVDDCTQAVRERGMKRGPRPRSRSKR